MDQYRAVPNGALALNLSYHSLQWIATLLTPKVAINGHVQRRKWGAHLIELPPGHHHVRVSFPYLFSDDCGPAEAMVPVHPGMVTRLDYQCPLVVFANGTLSIYGPFQSAQPNSPR
jgi:hypothetical protein